jgi:serine/threonine-protein kinase RsbW
MLLPGQSFAESYPAVPEAVAEARNAVAEFARDAGADDEQLEMVRLVASEAVTNVVLHAYRERERGNVDVSASHVEDELWLLVADAGDGMRAQADSPGLGLGLALIARLTDDLQILSRGSGGTELRLRFNLTHRKRRDPRRGAIEPPALRGQSGDSGRRGSISAAVAAA